MSNCGCKLDWRDSDTGHDVKACIDGTDCKYKAIKCQLILAHKGYRRLYEEMRSFEDGHSTWREFRKYLYRAQDILATLVKRRGK